MIKTPKAKEYGKRMRVISTMYLNKSTKMFFGGQWEEDDVELLYNDAANLSMIGQYMIEGNLDAAYGLATELDTLVRDEIPNSIWNYLQKYTIDQDEQGVQCLHPGAPVPLNRPAEPGRWLPQHQRNAAQEVA